MQQTLNVQQINQLQQHVQLRGLDHDYTMYTYELQLDDVVQRPQCHLYILDQHRQLDFDEVIPHIHPYFAARYQKLAQTAYDGVLKNENVWDVDEKNRRLYFMEYPTMLDEALESGYDVDEMISGFMRHIIRYVELVQAVHCKDGRQWLFFLDEHIYYHLNDTPVLTETFHGCRGDVCTYGSVIPLITSEHEIPLEQQLDQMITFYYEPGQRSAISRELLEKSSYKHFHYRMVTYVRNRCVMSNKFLQDEAVAEVHGKELIGKHSYFGDVSVFSIDDIVILEDTEDGAVKKRAIQEAISIIFECLPSHIIVINNVLAEKMFTREQLATLKFELLPEQFQYYMQKEHYHGVALKAI